MASVKEAEFVGISLISWDDAAQQIVDNATRKMKRICSVHIKEYYTMVHKNKIVGYRITADLCFEPYQNGS